MKLIEIPEILMQGERPSYKPPIGAWIAGGSIRRWFSGEKQDSDVDVFFPTKESMDVARTAMSSAKVLSETETAITYILNGKIVQFIKRHFKDIETTLNSFDFHLCQFAWDGTAIYGTIEGVCGVLRKRLSMSALQPGFEVDSLRRAFKYARTGYWPCNGTIKALAVALSGVTDATAQAERLSPHGRFD